jgi:hypothetical protein
MTRILACSMLLVACGDPPSSSMGPTDGSVPPCAESDNDAVRLSLEPTCIACHGTGASKPFFASLRSFEDLLVYDPFYVTPGDPGGSRLMALLEGRATGAFTQMPLGGEPFATRADRGETAIDMAALRDWITTLPPRGASDTEPDAESIATRPIRAEEILRTLADQVGLDFETDFVQSVSRNFDSPTIVLQGPFPARSPDAVFDLHYGADAVAEERFTNLGGPSWLGGVIRRKEMNPGFTLTLSQLSQAWCSYAIVDLDRTALFRHAGADDPSSTHEAEIKENLAYVHLRMLGEVATAAEIDRLYDSLFLPYESADSPRTAWVAVCSAMVRHPLWMTF